VDLLAMLVRWRGLRLAGPRPRSRSRAERPIPAAGGHS